MVDGGQAHGAQNFIGYRTWPRDLKKMAAYGVRVEFHWQKVAYLHAKHAAGNPLLTKTYREINARVQSLRWWRQAVQEHEQMMQALERDTVIELLRNGETYLTSPA